jgi:hypothetical protein
MNYRYKLQESLNDNQKDYTLKTNEELKDIIRNFGCGETEFHTGDIERLIKEHEKMHEILQALTFALSIDGKKDMANKNLIETANTAIDLYRP